MPAHVLEEGYRDVEIGGCKVRIGGMYEYAFALDGDNSAENLTGDVRDFLEEFQNTDRYKIMLCHRPDSFVFGDASDYWKIDLVISGHDHGGQVVIPFKEDYMVVIRDGSRHMCMDCTGQEGSGCS